jgi:hypothetical protein
LLKTDLVVKVRKDVLHIVFNSISITEKKKKKRREVEGLKGLSTDRLFSYFALHTLRLIILHANYSTFTAR